MTLPPPEQRVPPSLGAALAVLPSSSVNMGALPKGELLTGGRVVMISFVATWCFPCVTDLPVMQKLQDDLGPKGYQTIAVGFDLEGPKVLRMFAEQYALPYPMVTASDEIRGGESVFGRVRELPTRYLFARDGSLVMAFSGVADPKELIAAVTKVVDAK